jgi:hypothetical protein
MNDMDGRTDGWAQGYNPARLEHDFSVWGRKKKRPMHVWRLEMLGVLLLGSGGGGYGLGYRVLGMSSLYIGIACVKNWEWRLFGSGVGYH